MLVRDSDPALCGQIPSASGIYEEFIKQLVVLTGSTTADYALLPMLSVNSDEATLLIMQAR
jgi:hypothetical protein